MKKNKSLVFFLMALMLLSGLGCGEKKASSGGGEDVFAEPYNSTAPRTTTPAKDPAPVAHSDTGGNPAKTVVIDDKAATTTTTTTTTEQKKDEMTDSGFTVQEEQYISWIVQILGKKVNGYGDVTKNLMNKKQCSLFLSEKYRTPLNALNFWGRHRFDRGKKEEVQEQLKALAAWKIENYEKKVMLKRLLILEEAWNRTRPFEVTNPN